MSIFRDIDDIIMDRPKVLISSPPETIIEDEEKIDIDSDSEKFGKYYIMEKDGTISRSKAKLDIKYEPLNLYIDDEKLGSYKATTIIDDLENISKYATDVKLTNYTMDSSEEEMNNINILKKEYSTNVFKYVGGYKNMDIRYKNKLNKVKNKLYKIKIYYPEYYYLHGGLKLDHKINKELTNDYINFSNVEKIIKRFNKFKI